MALITLEVAPMREPLEIAIAPDKFQPFPCPIFTPDKAVELLTGRYGTGWFEVCYPCEITKVTSFSFPRVSVYDTETWVTNGSVPILATLIDVERRSLYVWVSPYFTNPAPCNEHNLFLETVPGLVDRDTYIFAHNASYDAIRTRATYTNIKQVRWMDTQSLFTAVRGLSNQQRVAKDSLFSLAWEDEGAGGSLSDLTSFYLGAGEAISPQEKKLRKRFVTMSSPVELLPDAAEVLNYAVKDVYALHLALKPLLTEWFHALPSEDSRNSHSILMESRLPVDPKQWRDWVRGLEESYENHVKQVESFLCQRKEAALTKGPDQHTSHLDWSTPTTGKYKGIPKWATGKLSLSSVSGVSLLELFWDGKVVVHDKDRKWGYLDNGFQRIPHPSGNVGANVGSPVSKDLLKDPRLSSPDPEVKQLLDKERTWAYYVSMRSRLEAVWPVWHMGQGCIMPSIRPTGTLTRRCADPTWLVTTYPSPKVCASEMLTMVSSPKGYRFVGADVDAQELRIASFLADWYDGEGWGHGAFSKSVLYGDKDKQTDPHTITALNIGLTVGERQIGKVINFLMVYLGGVTALSAKLSAETDLSLTQCVDLAHKAVQVKRGRKTLSGRYVGGTDSSVYNAMLAIADGLTPPLWAGGVVCDVNEPAAPFSGAKMSYALRRGVCRGDYTPSRANWVIQTTGADMRDYVVCRVSETAPWAQLVLTRHDEYWYMVEEERVREFATIFQWIHREFWTLFAQKLGLGELPSQYRWFSEVNVDTTLRKSPKSIDTPTWKCNHRDTGYILKPADLDLDVAG